MEQRDVRYTPQELKAKLIEYHKAEATVVDENELHDILDETSIRRYSVGDEALNEVQKVLFDLAKDLPEGHRKNEALLAIDKIDHAANEIVCGAMNLNKGMPFIKPILARK